MRLKDLNVISKVFKARFQYIHFHCEGGKTEFKRCFLLLTLFSVMWQMFYRKDADLSSFNKIIFALFLFFLLN